MNVIVELRPVSCEPGCYAVFRDGDDLGDIEQLADGTWVGDITKGNGPPSKPYATQAEAVAYVVDPSGTKNTEPTWWPKTTYEPMLAITTDGCGTVFLEGEGGVVAQRRTTSESEDEFIDAVADMLREQARVQS